MREDAVVRTPRVQRLSLIATGTPASGASRQRSGSRSISCARAIARSATTVLKAFSWGLTASMRASACVQTAAAERERTASRTSRMVEYPAPSTPHPARRASYPAPRTSRTSSNDPRYFEKTGVDRGIGSRRERLGAAERGQDLVRPIGPLTGEHRRGGRDTGRVDLL